MIEIKKAGINDLKTLMQWRMEVLHHVFGLPDDADMSELEEANRQYYKEQLPTGGHIACFALVDGEIVGCGGVCIYSEMPSPDNHSGRCAYLMNIYCRVQYRGSGVGRTIVKWLIGEAEKQGITKIYLETSEKGRHLYEHLGFKDMVDYLKLC